MAQVAGAEARKVGYSRARLILLGVGLLVLLLVAGAMYARRVDPVEVEAVLLYIVVFIGFVFWNVEGGLIAGVLASLAYFGLRNGVIQATVDGFSKYAGLLATRSIAYLVFGLLGGWANKQLSISLTKLELYDQIDDVTGLYNARFFLQDTDLEMSRSRRYHTIFSLALVDLSGSDIDTLSRRQRDALLRELGRMLKESVRTVDRAVHGTDKHRYRIAVVLPETGRQGAQTFADRLAERLRTYLSQKGVSLTDGTVKSDALTFPDDEESVNKLRSEFAEIDRAEHPEEILEARPAAARSDS